MKTLKSLKELKSLKGQLVAQANSRTVKHSSYSFKDKNGVHFIPAAEINSEVQTLEGPKIGGFNSSRLLDYLKNGYSYSQNRKFEIHKEFHSRKNWNKIQKNTIWDKLFKNQIESALIESEFKILEEKFLNRISEDIVKD